MGFPPQFLVIGNATVDETYSVSRLPAHGESILGELRLQDVGGKGANVATILARCGLPTRLTAVVGSDDRGQMLERALSTEPLELDLICTASQPTDVSLICSDAEGNNTIVTTAAAAQTLKRSDVRNTIDRMTGGGTLILQANLSETLSAFAIDYANYCGLATVFNPSPYAPWIETVLNKVDIAFVNEQEAHALTACFDEAAVTAILEMGIDQVVLTRGARSAIYGSAHNHDIDHSSPLCVRIPAARARRVVDTTAAGDTYLAVALASAKTRDTRIDQRALQHAAKAAAVTVSSYGTRSAFPDMQQLSEILRS